MSWSWARFARRVSARLALAIVMIVTVWTSPGIGQDAAGPTPVAANRSVPLVASPSVLPALLRWDLLRLTFYDPRGKIVWPDSLRSQDGERVRLEGYLMPRFGTQDAGDLLLTGLHPRSLFCGPTDMTAIVEVYIDGFRADPWPDLPVEVTGTFRLSRRPGDYSGLYRVVGASWRALRRWEQDFPGVVEESNVPLDDGGR